MKNNLNKIRNDYWINISTREAYKDDTDVYSYTGKLLAPQEEKAQIPAVDLNAFVDVWNKNCPVNKPGERWACFTEDSEIPLAIVERHSVDNYIISTVYGQTWFDPYSAINLIRISEKPIPFPDTKRGCWKIDLIPYRGAYSETASIYVEYIGHTIRFFYYSCYSREVGSMGHFEDYPYSGSEQHEESEFSSREQMIKCLLAFIPKTRSSSAPLALPVHMDDVQLYELLSYYIAVPGKKVQNNLLLDKKAADCWEDYIAYYNKYYINWEKPYREILRHSEKIHLLRLDDFIPISRLADESLSLDDFICAIGKEMSKAGIRINKEENDQRNEYYRERYEYFTFFEYNLGSISKSYSISPEEAAWFYLLLNREKAEKILGSRQLEKLNSLLASDYSVIENRAEIPENCMAKLMLLRKVYVNPECSVYNWDYAINNAVCNGDRKKTIAALYAYHMGCSDETAIEETEKALNKTIDPKLKACYPGWEIEVARGKIYMRKQFKDLSLEDWLGFEHPFFKAHSKNPAESAKQYYLFCSSELWNFPDELHGYIDRIDSFMSENMMEETPDKLILWHDKSIEYNTRESSELKFEFVSDNANDISMNTRDCGVPCKGWYDKNGRRYLAEPLGMTGLFEYCDTSGNAEASNTTVRKTLGIEVENSEQKPERTSEKQTHRENVFSRMIARILNAMNLETVLTILLISVVILLVIVYRLLWRLLASEKLAGFVLLGLVLAVMFTLWSRFRKKRTKK